MKKLDTNPSIQAIKGKVTQEVRDKENKSLFKVTFIRKGKR